MQKLSESPSDVSSEFDCGISHAPRGTVPRSIYYTTFLCVLVAFGFSSLMLAGLFISEREERFKTKDEKRSLLEPTIKIDKILNLPRSSYHKMVWLERLMGIAFLMQIVSGCAFLSRVRASMVPFIATSFLCGAYFLPSIWLGSWKLQTDEQLCEFSAGASNFIAMTLAYLFGSRMCRLGIRKNAPSSYSSNHEDEYTQDQC